MANAGARSQIREAGRQSELVNESGVSTLPRILAVSVSPPIPSTTCGARINEVLKPLAFSTRAAISADSARLENSSTKGMRCARCPRHHTQARPHLIP